MKYQSHEDIREEKNKAIIKKLVELAEPFKDNGRFGDVIELSLKDFVDYILFLQESEIIFTHGGLMFRNHVVKPKLD